MYVDNVTGAVTNVPLLLMLVNVPVLANVPVFITAPTEPALVNSPLLVYNPAIVAPAWLTNVLLVVTVPVIEPTLWKVPCASSLLILPIVP